MFADELRAAIERAPRITLPQVTALLWRAYGEGKVTEAEAEALSVLIDARRLSGNGPRLEHAPNPRGTGQDTATNTSQDRQSAPRRPGTGSRPRTDASLERRRRWAASGRLPPGLAARFTLAEQAVLALVATETARHGDYRLAHEHAAALAGVSRSTVKNAIREARRLGLLTVEERPVTGFRNLPNIVRIAGREWLAWLRLARKPGGYQGNPDAHASPSEGGGVKCATGTPTQVLDPVESWPAGPSKRLPTGGGRPHGERATRIRATGRTGRAMR